VSPVGDPGFGGAPLDDRPFPASTGGLGHRSLHRQNRAIRTAFQNFRSIDISVNCHTTGYANELRLRLPAPGVHGLACVTRLRTVPRVNNNELSSGLLCFVAEVSGQATPARIQNASRQPFVHGSHVSYLQTLNNNSAVAVGVVSAEDVHVMRPLTCDFFVQSRYPALRLFSVFRTLFTSTDDSLRFGESSHCTCVELGRGMDGSIAVGHDIHHSAIQRDYRFNSPHRSRCLNLTGERSEPLVAVSGDRTGFRNASWRPVEHRADYANFRKTEAAAYNAPLFRVRLAERNGVLILAFESRPLSRAFEVPCPRRLQPLQKLSSNVPRHIRKPRKFRTQLCQFVDLVKSAIYLALSARTRKCQSALVVCDVPEEPKGILPPQKSAGLKRGRIDPVAICFIRRQRSSIVSGLFVDATGNPGGYK
jgi:hypothetical protein